MAVACDGPMRSAQITECDHRPTEAAHVLYLVSSQLAGIKQRTRLGCTTAGKCHATIRLGKAAP